MKKLLRLALASVFAVTMVLNVSAVYDPGTSSTNMTPDIAISHDKNPADNIADTAAGIHANESAAEQKEIPINATIKAGGTQHVLAASVDKTTLEFTYSKGGLIWDPVRLEYVSQGTDTAWSSADPTITVTNYSDVDVTVTAAVKSLDDPAVQFTVSNDGKSATAPCSVTIPSAWDRPSSTAGVGQAKSNTFTVSALGTPTHADSPDAFQIAALTLTLKPTLPIT